MRAAHASDGGSVDVTLAKIGVVCIIAAIVGGTFKAAGIEFGTLNEVTRQIMLAGFGLVLIFVDWLRDRQDDAPEHPVVAEKPLVAMVVAGIVVGIAFAAILNGAVGAVKSGGGGPGAVFNAAKDAIVFGNVLELGAILGAVCGASWSFLQRRFTGAVLALMLVIGAVLGASGRFLNPPGVRVETTPGMIRAAALGAILALVLALVLRRLRI